MKKFPPNLTRTDIKVFLAKTSEALVTLSALAELQREHALDRSSRGVRADAALEAVSNYVTALYLDDPKMLGSFIESFPAEDPTDTQVQ